MSPAAARTHLFKRKAWPQVLGKGLLGMGMLGAIAASAACLSEAEVAAMADAYQSRTPAANPRGLTPADGECSRSKLNRLLQVQLGEPVGYKAGLTNPAVQKRFNHSSPVWGTLYGPMMLANGSVVDAAFGARPLFEADMLVRISSDTVNEAHNAVEVLAAIDRVIPAIELPDLMVQAPALLNGAAVTAINVGARYFVQGLGIPVPVTRMAVREILKMGDARLLRVAPPVAAFDTPELHALVPTCSTPWPPPRAPGLAAPQIGVDLQVVIFGFTTTSATPTPAGAAHGADQPGDHAAGRRLVEETAGKAACRCPACAAWCRATARIRYTGFDAPGPADRPRGRGFPRRVVQHECDHLIGRLYPTRMSDLTSWVSPACCFPTWTRPTTETGLYMPPVGLAHPGRGVVSPWTPSPPETRQPAAGPCVAVAAPVGGAGRRRPRSTRLAAWGGWPSCRAASGGST
jgi:2-keto-4-pentenoate hydratase/peptide deformylase